MITIELKDAEVAEALRALAASLADMSPVMSDIGQYMVRSTNARFVAGVSPEGTPWAAKSPVTLANYARKGDPADPRPLFGPSGRLSSEINYQPSPRSVEIGTNMIYAAVQHFGAAQGAFGARMGRTKPSEKRPKSQDYFFHIPWGTIPARPFLGVSDEDRTALLDLIEEWLESAVQ